jgi:hypothetical protein
MNRADSVQSFLTPFFTQSSVTSSPERLILKRYFRDPASALTTARMNETYSTQVTTMTSSNWPLHQLQETAESSTAHQRQIGTRPAIITPGRATNWAASVARDASSADLVNFPFAIATYFTFVIGAVFFGWGAILDNLWLASAGFFTALVASVFYGLARHND